MSRMQNRPGSVPRLIPTGNVDDVLLTGKSRGKDLTMSQSIGLAIFGLFFVLFAGIPDILFEFSLQSEFDRMDLPYAKDVGALLSGGLMCILGGAWIAMGLVGIVKAAKRRAKT